MADVTIYHNPACTTSRKVLAAIRETGTEPRVIEYLEDAAEPGGAETAARRNGHDAARAAAAARHAV